MEAAKIQRFGKVYVQQWTHDDDVPGRSSTSEQCCSAHSSVVRTRSAPLLHDTHALNDSTSAALTMLNWTL